MIRRLLCPLLGHDLIPWQPVCSWSTSGLVEHSEASVRWCRRCFRGMEITERRMHGY